MSESISHCYLDLSVRLAANESIINLSYDNANAIIQGSWNWPMGRKDLEAYGKMGAVYADNRHTYRKRIAEGYDGFKETVKHLPERTAPYDDPFHLFKAAIKKDVILNPNDLSALENNMVVIEILDAARRSAKSAKSVYLDEQ